MEKINGSKPITVFPDLKISPEEFKRLWDLAKPNPIATYDFPLIFGTSGPDFFDPCYNCGNNPKNNPNASGNCWCSLPSKNITY